MATNPRLPIFLLAFANEQPQSARFLRNLAQELSRLRKRLERADAPYQVVFYPNMTVEELLDALHNYRSRIALFHYGGHSNSYSLLLQSADGHPTVAYSGGLAKLLAHQRGLHLLFLNGCANEAQVQALLTAGIAVVVATSALIDDKVAMAFADHFYAALAGAATIKEAFQQASAAVELSCGENQRHLHRVEASDTLTHPPWQLFYQDAAAIEWRLADLINDPCWGLPPAPRLDLPTQPFRGLDWFRRNHAEIFFGRGQEIRTLYDWIDDPDGAPLILLYGQSGVGKSSLLEAGLLPRLAVDYIPRYVRRDRELGLTGSMENELCARTTNRDLHTVWQEHERTQGKPLILILDQVEEVFTRPQAATTGSELAGTELEKFLTTVHQLFTKRDQRPQGKLILGFRKEYLAEIEVRLNACGLSHRKMFLEPLRQRGIREAVAEVAHTPRLQQHYGLTVEEGLPDLIANDLLHDLDSPLAPTLQILLSKLWERAIARSSSQPRFDAALYRQLRDEGILLSDFFEQSLQALHALDAEAVDAGLVLDLLVYHTTPRGTAEQHSAETLCASYPHLAQGRLARLVQGCKDHYLLADPAKDQTTPPGQAAASRLAHDALAPLVSERFARSEAPSQRARRLLESCVIEWRHDPQNALLNDGELTLVEQKQAYMRVWTADEQKLVEDSRRARTERQRQAEQQRAAQTWQRRIRRLLVATVAVVTVISLSVISMQSLGRQRAEDDKKRAESQRLADLAQQQLTADPVASLRLALSALPSADAPQPYVPRAEFDLIRALNTSLERVYLPVAQSSLSAPQVALSRDWIAVGGKGLWLVPYNLTEKITVTVVTTGSTVTPLKTVAWNSAEDALLSQEDRHLRVWQGNRQIATTSFAAPIACAAWQPTGEHVVVCADREVALWRYREHTRTPVFRFADKVLAARWSPDGRWLVAWDAPYAENQQVIIWDSQTAQLWRQEELSPTVQVRSAAWAPDSHHLVVGRSDGVMHVWRIGADGRVDITNEHSIDEIEFIDQERFLTWGITDVVRLWSITGTRLHALGDAADDIAGFHLSPDGSSVLVLLNDGTARQYALASGVRTQEYVGHDKRIVATAWRPNGKYLATSAIDGTARVWDVTTGNLLITLSGHTGDGIPGRGDVLGVRWQPDDRLLTYGEDGSFRLWAIFDQQGLPLCTGTDRERKPRCHATAQSFAYHLPIQSAHWLDNDTIITVDEDHKVQRVARITGNVQEICAGSDAYSAAAPWNAAGGRFLFFLDEEEGNGIVCDLEKGLLTTAVAGPITSAHWVGDHLLISRSTGETQVMDLNAGVTVTTLQGLTSTVTAAQVNGAGQLATATADGLIRIWAMASGAQLSTLGADLPTDKRGGAVELDWSADGKQLLAAGQEVILWNVAQAQPVWLEPGNPLLRYGAMFSPDQKRMAVSAGNSVFILAAENREMQWRGSHTDSLLGFQWFTGVRWQHEQRYHPLLGRLARWLSGGPWTVSATRPLLLTWSGDGTAKIWEPAAETELMRLADRGPMTTAGISPDRSHIFTISDQSSAVEASAVLRIWPVWQQSPDTLLTEARQRLTHPLTEAQLAAFSIE